MGKSLNLAVSCAGFHDPHPPVKDGGIIASTISHIGANVRVPPHRQAKVGAFGNRGRTLGLQKQRDKS